MKRKLPLSPANTIVLDPVTGKLAQMGHIVHGPKVLPYTEAVCEECGRVYGRRREDQRFCSTVCRMKWWRKQRYGGIEPELGVGICVVCSSPFTKTRAWSKCCSEDCRIENRRRQVKEFLERKRQAAVAEAHQEA